MPIVVVDRDAVEVGDLGVRVALGELGHRALLVGDLRVDLAGDEVGAAELADELREAVRAIFTAEDNGWRTLFPRAHLSEVTIETNDGRTLEHYQPTRIGDPDAPLTDDQIADKFKELVVPVIGEAAAKALLDACWSLEKLDSVRELPFRIGRAAQAAE